MVIVLSVFVSYEIWFKVAIIQRRWENSCYVTFFSSIGMAKSALEAINGFNLFGNKVNVFEYIKP